jgi:NAD(P)H-hydrate repair Nnr-like enzyme with NAD(P)H-hydrate dehydratase domain
MRAAELYRSVVLVKGVDSHVVTPNGECWTYQGGAPGLGVSGSGDVLAGIVGGLLARGAEPLNALLWAVWLHGEAGAALANKVGPIGFLAREIADEVPALLPR